MHIKIDNPEMRARSQAMIAARQWTRSPNEKPDQTFARCYLSALRDLRRAAWSSNDVDALWVRDHFAELEVCLYWAVAARVYGVQGRDATLTPEYN
jgi:hypothetical protein